MTPGFLALIGEDRPPDGLWPGGTDSATNGPAWLAASSAAGAATRGPRVLARGPLVAVADLRLDNRDALQVALGDAGSDDLSLLLAGYERWADGIVERLDGPFAFVIWDGRRQRATCARDALGLRPLYHARRGRGVVLGSSLRAVQAIVAGAVCQKAVADHLAGRFDHPDQTFVEGIARIPAAHAGSVALLTGRATLSTRRYWTIDPERATGSDSEAETAFRVAFDRAVLARLGEGTGALLSGGLDSSSIVATVRALRPAPPLPTFSIVYDAPGANERRYLDAVAAHVGVEPVRLEGEALSLLADLDADLLAVGEPFPTPNLFLTRRLYAEAASRGLSAVLDGFAGDNVVGHGDLWLTELVWSFRWRAFAREIRAAARRSARPRYTALTLTQRYALGPLAHRFERSPWGFQRPDLTPTSRPRPPSFWRDRDLHHAEIVGPSLSRAFETAYARASALGVEPRFPFADRSLVEVCVSLPPRQRVRDGLTRSILRRALADRLPAVLLARTGKARLDLNFEHALFERDPERLRDLVEHDVPAADAFLDVHAVQSAYRRGVAHPESRADVALPLWRAVSLARWLSLSP